MTRGSIYGLLGRNGSGKTTTVKMLLGITRADSGAARVFGLDALLARPLRQARGGRGRR